MTTFRSILALAEDIPLFMPLGVSAFHKSGSIDFRHEHALTLMGRRVHPRSPLGLRPLGIQVLRNIFAWIKDAFGTCH